MKTTDFGKYTYRNATYTTAAIAGEMSAANDVAQVDIRDLVEVSLFVNKLVDTGTCTLHFDASADGVNWVADVFSSKTDSAFAAGTNVAVNVGTLSDTNGMPIRYQQLRVPLTAKTGALVFSVGASGTQIPGYGG